MCVTPDHVFGTDYTTDQIFYSLVQPLVFSVMEGFNSMHNCQLTINSSVAIALNHRSIETASLCSWGITIAMGYGLWVWRYKFYKGCVAYVLMSSEKLGS